MNSNSWRTYFLFVTVGLVSHGLLLINDGSYADGWFLEYYIGLGRWDVVKDWWYSHGYPVNYWLQRLLGDASVFTYRALTLSSILLTAIFQYKILTRFTPLTENQCRYITLLSIVWPFNHLLVWSVFVTGMVFPILFYTGWYGYLCLKEKGSHPLLYLPCLILIFFSFNVPIYLTYHYVFAAIYAISLRGYSLKFNPGEMKTQIIAFVKQNWVLVILPLGFYYLKNSFFPVSSTYNKIQFFSLTSIFSTIKNVFRIITEPILSIIYSVPTFWFILIPGLMAAILLLLKYFKKDPDPIGRKYIFGMIAIGLIFIATHSFTYGVVGKTIKIMSAKSRHAFGANLGYGLFLLGGVHWLFNKYWDRKRELIQPVLALILVAMILVNWNLHAMWQARWAKTISIIHHLKQQSPIPNVSIYFLRDRFPLGVDTSEFSWIFNFILMEGWNVDRFMAITPHFQGKLNQINAAQKMNRERMNPEFFIYKFIKNFNPKGCMAEVVVSPKKYHQQVLIGFRYLYYRLLEPRQMPQYLEDLTEVKLRPLHIDAWDRPCS